MNGNICPQCGKDVMPYGRFLREAEPYKMSSCGNCGVKLKRNPKVYLFLLISLVILIAISIPLFLGMVAAHLSFIIIWPTMIIWIACWTFLVNYISWRYISWIIAETKNK